MAITYHAGRRIQGIETDRIISQGYAGGNAVSSTQSAGGGGAGGTATGSNNKDGGIGKANPIVGSTHGESSGGSYYLAGGGGGAGEASGTSTGGLGGGGNGGSASAASTEATSGYGGGAGGGGNSGTNYPNGASGVVILKLLTSSSFSSSNATPSTTGSYTILTYTSTSSSSFTISSGTADVQYLVVAGGGASKDNWGYAGGGGAGGFRTGTKTSLASGTYTVTVGAGGIGAGSTTIPANGDNSVFSDITSSGGGGAGSWQANSGTGFDGGSGGGAQGNSGGNDIGGATISLEVIPTNVQAGSRFEETDTRKMYHYGDYPTVSDDLTTDKGWLSNTGSWTYNATGDYIDFATITRSTTAQRIYIDVQDSDYLGSGNNLSDSSWVARFKIRTGTQSSSQGNVLLYLGFSNNLEDSGTTQQSATMMMNFNGQANENNMQLSVSRANFETTASPARVNSDVYSNPNLPYSTDRYMEMTRNGDVFTLKAYSDEYITQATSTSIASVTVTGISTLRYIKAFNDSEQAQSYTSGGARLYDMKIYNGVTSAGNEWKELGT